MTRRLLFVMLLVAAPACSVLPGEAPPLADSLLIDVMVDLHLAAARSEAEGQMRPALQRDSILARHGLNPAQFDAAVRYYADRPTDYVALYGRVIDRLDAERLPPDDAPR